MGVDEVDEVELDVGVANIKVELDEGWLDAELDINDEQECEVVVDIPEVDEVERELVDNEALELLFVFDDIDEYEFVLLSLVVICVSLGDDEVDEKRLDVIANTIEQIAFAQ